MTKGPSDRLKIAVTMVVIAEAVAAEPETGAAVEIETVVAVAIEKTDVIGTVVVTVVIEAVEIGIEAGVPVGKKVDVMVEVETHEDPPLTETIGAGHDRGATVETANRTRELRAECVRRRMRSTVSAAEVRLVRVD